MLMILQDLISYIFTTLSSGIAVFPSFLQPISAESSALRFDVIEVNVSLFLKREMLFATFLSHNVNVKVTTNP